jgi:hypothetical protein
MPHLSTTAKIFLQNVHYSNIDRHRVFYIIVYVLRKKSGGIKKKIRPTVKKKTVDSQALAFKHWLWHRRWQMSFQLGTWCAFAQTEREQASEHASTSLTPQTVTHVSGVGSLEKAPTLPSILFEVQTLSQTNWSVEPLLSRPRSCSSSRPREVLIAWRTTNAGTTVPTTPHHHSTILLPYLITCQTKQIQHHLIAKLQNLTAQQNHQSSSLAHKNNPTEIFPPHFLIPIP